MSKVQEILPAEVAERLRNKEALKIIDIRTDEEVEQGMIREAIHIPMFELADSYQDWDRGEEIIFVCRSGRRSLAVCQVLTMEGFRNVKNMTGGMLAYPNES
ncbi:rhodanese-like domain-containing protein [Tumebacillus lipolyticus]|uniref:Rhodanese-like domain-containing protein n=1 Tax=Tumebacillus lipolyticus TaxID=1280370 RepID=A0ABW5A1D8_9BACL